MLNRNWCHLWDMIYLQGRTLYSWSTWLLNDVLQGTRVAMFSKD